MWNRLFSISKSVCWTVCTLSNIAGISFAKAEEDSFVVNSLPVSWPRDPWQRPTHARVIHQAPQSWEDIFSHTRPYRFWWDDMGVTATIEVQEKLRWKVIATDVAPGWISPPMPSNKVFRIRLQGGTRNSVVIRDTAWITPTDLAQLAKEQDNATLSNSIGEMHHNSETNTTWIALDSGGVLSIQGDERTLWTTWSGLPDNRVISVTSTGADTIIGTATGFAWIRDGQVRGIRDNDLIDPYVQALAITDKKLYIGTYKGLQTMYGTSSEDHSTQTNTLIANNSIFSIFTSENDIWVGHNGITQIEERADGTSTQRSHSWTGPVYSITKHNGDLYVATTNKGVVQFSNGTSNTVLPVEATSMLSMENQLWVAGGETGLWTIPQQSILPALTVWSLAPYQTPTGPHLLLGTNTGLHTYTPHTKQLQANPISNWSTDQSTYDLYISRDHSKGIISTTNGIFALGADSDAQNAYFAEIAPTQKIFNILEITDTLLYTTQQDILFWDANENIQKISTKKNIIDAQIWKNKIWIQHNSGIQVYNTLWSDDKKLSSIELEAEYPLSNNISTLSNILSIGLNALWTVSKEKNQQYLVELQYTGDNIESTKHKVPPNTTITSVASSGLTVCLGTKDGVMRYWKTRENGWEDVLGDQDEGVEISAVAADIQQGCWASGIDGSIMRIDKDGNMRILRLAEPDPPRVWKIIPDGNFAWILTEKGTWYVEIPT